MKKLLVTMALCGLFSIPSFAGDLSKIELFGGFQLLNVSGDEFDIDGGYYTGFTTAVEGNLNSYLSIVAEFGYFQRHDSVEEYEFDINGVPFLFGPRASYRVGGFRVFGHYQLGGLRSSVDFTPNFPEGINFAGYKEGNTTSFSQALGGGVDIAVNNLISIRPAQIDWYGIRYNNSGSTDWKNLFRYSGGVIFKFGSR